MKGKIEKSEVAGNLEGEFTKDMATKMAEEILEKTDYITICQGISKPENWKRAS